MEQVPHWLMVTVFAAGMTAYAEEVAPQLDGTPISGDAARTNYREAELVRSSCSFA